MTKPRVAETDEGIQGEFDVRMYDAMARRLRDRSWLETPIILKAGITSGTALEMGSGPGYMGLEWLKKTDGTRLEGLEISPDMIKIAEKNAMEYGLADRVKYVQGDVKQMPFPDGYFDGVMANGTLHEWAEPGAAFNEMYRVLKPGGRFAITDLRRDMSPLIKWLMLMVTKPKEIKPGLISSINASYTLKEIRALLEGTRLMECNNRTKANLMGLVITGKKQE